MDARERVDKALHRETPDRIPKYADFSPAVLEAYYRHIEVNNTPISLYENRSGRLGVSYLSDNPLADPAEYFDYDIRLVEFGETLIQNDFSDYLHLPAKANHIRIDEWGVGWQRGSEHHYERMIHPFARVGHLSELEKYPWPDVEATYRRKVAGSKINQIQSRGYAAVGWPPMNGGTFFETAWRLRGFEQFMIDMHLNQELAEYLLDKIETISTANACFLASSGADVIITGDDVGMQTGMLISPTDWRKWLKPRYARLIAEVKTINPKSMIFYHSDGDIRPIIPELIEIGIDILNPVQPECMNPEEIKTQYGDRLAFWGCIGTQTSFPKASPADMRKLVQRTIQQVGYDGGLLLAPTHKLQPDTPFENVLAFFEAIEEFGRYPVG